ncbi:MAG: STAS domain-containing protein [Deltaproteobacteria bacterium]|nr:STAS domain-containing protein [Deltaproteobacteria bacterium]
MSAIPVLSVGGCLLVTVQIDLKDTLADAFQEDLLTALSTSGARGLVIDISGLDFVDSYVARILAETGKMAHLMGAVTVLVGMRPTVASTLVRMGFRMEGVETALNVDMGLAIIAKLRAREQ